ncbi:MAG: hypothetical protein PVH54_02255 [Gammaproteobacteria bacterium]|jgi:hypothetical protein
MAEQHENAVQQDLSGRMIQVPSLPDTCMEAGALAKPGDLPGSPGIRGVTFSMDGVPAINLRTIPPAYSWHVDQETCVCHDVSLPVWSEKGKSGIF